MLAQQQYLQMPHQTQEQYQYHHVADSIISSNFDSAPAPKNMAHDNYDEFQHRRIYSILDVGDRQSLDNN
jgi:hypothetical protein